MIKESPQKTVIGPQPHIDNYFEQVEMFSTEHQNDIEKFSLLLDSLKKTTHYRYDDRLVAEVQKLLNDFNSYLIKRKYTLSEKERSDIAGITDSEFTLAVKKRLLEDFFYKTKEKVEKDYSKKLEKDIVAKEIRELHESVNPFVNWMKVTKFALVFGTLTLMTHRVKEQGLTSITEKLTEWQKTLQKAIQPILDNEYYALSTHQYNSLALIIEIKDSIKKLKEIPWNTSYDPSEISKLIAEFTALYVVILKNSQIIKNSAEIVFKHVREKHGLWWTLANFLDEPIANNKAVRFSTEERIQSTITGFLLSFYTAHKKKVVRTINQVMHLTGCEGKLDTIKKHLTKNALKCELESRTKKDTVDMTLSHRLEELERISGNFINAGKKYETRLYVLEAKSSYSKWISENKEKPILRIKRLVEGFIKYFVEVLNNPQKFIVTYDSAEYRNYFEIKPELTAAASGYNMINFDLTGIKTKDLMNISLPPDVDLKNFIKTLTEFQIPETAPNNDITAAHSVIKKIADKTFLLAQRLHELYSFYHERRQIINMDSRQNFDFFTNARIEVNKTIRTPLILNKDSITLKEFIEIGCSLAYFIANELSHPELDNINKEKKSLLEKIKNIQSNAQSNISKLETDSEVVYEAEFDDEITRRVDELYTDSLTRLKNRQYLDDQIIPTLYDDEKNYKSENPRFIFYTTIPDLREVTQKYGHDVGDQMIVEITRKIADVVKSFGTDNTNIPIRFSGNEIIGFLNNETQTKVVNLLVPLAQSINRISIEKNGEYLPAIFMSFGIYEERKGNNVYENISIARRIMYSVENKAHNNIGFIKDQKRAITEKDIDSSGLIHEDLLTVVH